MAGDTVTGTDVSGVTAVAARCLRVQKHLNCRGLGPAHIASHVVKLPAVASLLQLHRIILKLEEAMLRAPQISHQTRMVRSSSAAPTSRMQGLRQSRETPEAVEHWGKEEAEQSRESLPTEAEAAKS